MALLFSTLFLLNICCGCSGGEKQNKTNSNKLYLNENNYEDYLDLVVKTYKVSRSGNIVDSDDMGDITTSVTVKGTSSNFIYRDVSVTVGVNVAYHKGVASVQEKTVTMTADCDVAGNGSDSQTLEGLYYYKLDTDKCGYSIVNITGYVERA